MLALYRHTLLYIGYTLYVCVVDKKKSSQAQMNRMMVALMLTYYALFTPSIIESFISYNPETKIYVQNAFFMLFYTNGIVDFILYAWMSPELNKAFRKMFHCHCGGNVQEDNSNRGVAVISSNNSLTSQTSSGLINIHQ